jgi:hypothetical protein
MARLAEDLGIPSSFAAAEKLPVRATASKTTTWFRSTVASRDAECPPLPEGNRVFHLQLLSPMLTAPVIGAAE